MAMMMVMKQTHDDRNKAMAMSAPSNEELMTRRRDGVGVTTPLVTARATRTLELRELNHLHGSATRNPVTSRTRQTRDPPPHPSVPVPYARVTRTRGHGYGFRRVRVRVDADRHTGDPCQSLVMQERKAPFHRLAWRRKLTTRCAGFVDLARGSRLGTWSPDKWARMMQLDPRLAIDMSDDHGALKFKIFGD
ncbi:hypothetical protein EDB84DRAFT_1437768 [Lactarius hengduanensis]|nr:hypothetical protein EDB84DRAFT_1437768 [Lactarius hengduanensis]